MSYPDVDIDSADFADALRDAAYDAAEDASHAWTEAQHWVVMSRDLGEAEPHCAGHYPTYALAAKQARRLRVAGTYTHVHVQRTA